MEAYVLNLDNRPDRWRQCQRRFHGTGMHLHRVSAVPHSNGAYGNLQSFLNVIRMARTKRMPAILILEDDCTPRPGWVRRWKAIKHWLDTHPDTWDIFSGGCWDNAFYKGLASATGSEPVEVGRVDSTILFQNPFVSFGAHWIYIPKRTYSRFLSFYSTVAPLTLISPVQLAVDTYQGLLFKTICPYPFLAYQDSSYSSVDKARVDKEGPLKAYERRIARTLTRKKRRPSFSDE